MSKTSKIIATAGLIVVWFVIAMLNLELQKSSGNSSPGIIGLLLLIGLIAAIRSIWKNK